MSDFVNFPKQALSYKSKTKTWRKNCVLWASDKTYFNMSLIRNSVQHKMINIDLLNGRLNMEDLALMINPAKLKVGENSNLIPDKIQHYPIMNGKLELLQGEEMGRGFNYTVIITNPNSVSSIEETKRQEVLEAIQQTIQNQAQSEQEFQAKMQEISEYFTYRWKDMREKRANYLLKQYQRELNLPKMFNDGFKTALAVGEEFYKIDIVGGEPSVELIDPCKIRIYKSGYSNKAEDADLIILEDYWSPGKIIDVYYDVLSPADIKHIEEAPNNIDKGAVDEMDNIDPRYGFVHRGFINDNGTMIDELFDPNGNHGMNDSLMPYDMVGNIRVLQVYWKSKRKIKRVKSYNQETGEEEFNFYTEDYVIDEAMGEEEEIFWINEAWEGTMIGKDIFVNMRPRPIQYNRISNPSRCHFGIIGNIYNFNNGKPYSMVDRMKPYNYAYDIYHDRLNKLMARNWGKAIRLDLAKIPKSGGWTIDKYLYYLKNAGIAVEDSFAEGDIGAATGKLAGSMNNASNGIIDVEQSAAIQGYIQMLEWLKKEMSEMIGITPQREGQIQNRETVGGVERATLQSSHITEPYFTVHEDVKRRVCECLIETAKIALKGRSKKFEYVLDDGSKQIMEIDGDEFAENDYGLVVENGNLAEKLNQQLEGLAQAALQNQGLSFSTIMKIYSTSSIAEKQRAIEKNEADMRQMQQQMQQQQMQAEQEALQAQLQQKEAELQQKEAANIRDNETRIAVARIQTQAMQDQFFSKEYTDMLDNTADEDRAEKAREFDLKHQLNEKEFKLQQQQFEETKRKNQKDAELKRMQINKQKTSSTTR